MDEEKIKDILYAEYGINAITIERMRGTYKISCENKNYALKTVKYEEKHFMFIISAIEHLKKKGFDGVLGPITTKSGSKFIKLEGVYCFLTEWIEGRRSDYKNEDELYSVVRNVGIMHRLSEGFIVDKSMKPRIGWLSWINVFRTRLNEILDFKKRIYQKAYRSEFDKIYLNSIDEEIARGNKAIRELIENNYYKVMEKELFKLGFCHHDLAHHNILVEPNGKYKFIDFDYCILDSKIHDLSSILIRVMKGGEWSAGICKNILYAYKEENSLLEEQINLMKGFIRFPQSFWQIGLQYYWEQQPWEEEVFIEKINKYLLDRKERDEFIDEVFGGEGK